MIDVDAGEVGEIEAFGDGWTIRPIEHEPYSFAGLEGVPQQTYRLDFTHGEMVDPNDILIRMFGALHEQGGIHTGQLYANGQGEERDLPMSTIAASMTTMSDFIDRGGEVPSDSDGFTLSSRTDGTHPEAVHATFAQAVFGETAFLTVTVTELQGGRKADPVALLHRFTDVEAIGPVVAAESTELEVA